MASCSSRPGIARSRDASRAACRGIGATPVAAPAARLPSRKPSLLSHPPASFRPALSPRPRVAAVLRSSAGRFWTPGKDRAPKTRALKFTLAAIVALIPTAFPCARVSHSRLSDHVVLCCSTHHVSGILSRCRPMVGYLHRSVAFRAFCSKVFKRLSGATVQSHIAKLVLPACPGVILPYGRGQYEWQGCPSPESDVCGLPLSYPATHKGSRQVTPGPVSLSAGFACASRPVQIGSSSLAHRNSPVTCNSGSRHGRRWQKARCFGTGLFAFLDLPRGNQASRRCRHTPVPPQDTPQDGLAQAARPSVTPHPGGPASTPKKRITE